MGAQKLIFIRTHLYLLARGFFIHFLYGGMLRILCSLWVFLCSCFFYAVGTVRRYLSRVHAAEGSSENGKSSTFYTLEEEKQLNSDDKSRTDGEGSILLEAAASKYRFSSGIDIIGFVEEPKVLSISFVVEDFFFGYSDRNLDAVVSEEADLEGKIETCGENMPYPCNDEQHEPFLGRNLDAVVSEEAGLERKIETCGENMPNYSDDEQNEPLLGKIVSDVVDSAGSNLKFGFFTNGVLLGADEKLRSFSDDLVFEEADVVERRELFVEKSTGDENVLNEVNFLGEDQILDSPQIDSEAESIDHDFKFDSFSEEGDLPSIDDAEVASADFLNFGENIEEAEEAPITEETELSDDDYIEMKLEDTNDSEPFDDSNDDSKEFGVEKDPTFDDEDSMWEHDNIIEQLKLELKHARTGGLPTIVEETETESESESESNSPIAVMGGLKPLNAIAEQKPEHKDRIMEIMKVYKCYAEKMQKFDVLNYQTMHAIGLLHLKEYPYTSTESQKPYVPAIKSLISQNLTPQKLRKNKIGPAIRSMESLYADLETVCVGHVCLSWEILQWQYGKTRELLEFDLSSHRQYNQLANELQLFQVLLQRFMENEPFQAGPRIDNYVKNRCVLRSLLQVPAVRDDSFIDKKHKSGAENAVSGAKLVEILEESIRVLWDFVRSYKDEANSIHKLYRKPHSGLLDLDDGDLSLLMAVRNDLQKKERRLKDIVRSGNCIVKRFQKHHGRVDNVVLFAQIEMKLIHRVLNMRKLTRDRLVWCREKLNRTSFVSRKVYVDPSILLFPC